MPIVILAQFHISLLLLASVLYQPPCGSAATAGPFLAEGFRLANLAEP